MSKININTIVRGFGLVISSLLAVWVLSSCGTDNIGSLDASGLDSAAQSAGDSGRDVSYTAGANCVIPGGIAWPNVLNYGWRGGNVTEGFGPNWVSLNTAVGANPAWIEYHFQEAAAGRLQNIRIIGTGTLLTVYMYNFNTAGWTNFGTYSLSAAPINLAVGPAYAPNGLTYLKLVQGADAASRIDRIRTNVF